MFKKSIIWTNFANGRTVYEMFKEYGIGSHVKSCKKVTYVRIPYDGDCCFRWTPRDSTLENEIDAYEDWIRRGYTELKMFGEDKEYVGTI